MLFPLVTRKPQGAEAASKRGFIAQGFEYSFLTQIKTGLYANQCLEGLLFTCLNCLCAAGDELNDEAGSRPFHGRAQWQFEDRMRVETYGTSKNRSTIRKCINRKNVDLRKTLAKYMW